MQSRGFLTADRTLLPFGTGFCGNLAPRCERTGGTSVDLSIPTELRLCLPRLASLNGQAGCECGWLRDFGSPPVLNTTSTAMHLTFQSQSQSNGTSFLPVARCLLDPQCFRKAIMQLSLYAAA